MQSWLWGALMLVVVAGLPLVMSGHLDPYAVAAGIVTGALTVVADRQRRRRA